MFLNYADNDVLNEDMDLSLDDNWFDEQAVFCENCDGLFEQACESEQTWNNIMMESMIAEHKAIMNEDSVLLEEEKVSTGKKIIEWIKEKARQVAQFFKNLLNKIKISVLNINKFVDKNKNKISDSFDASKIKTYTWETVGTVSGIFKSFGDKAKEIDKLSNNATDSEAVKKVSEGIKTETLISSIRSKEKSKGANGLKPTNCMKELKDCKSKMQSFNILEKNIQGHLKAMMTVAKAADKDSAKSNKSIIIANKKTLVSCLDRITGACVTCYTSRVVDLLTVARAGVKSGKKNNKEETEDEIDEI